MDNINAQNDWINGAIVYAKSFDNRLRPISSRHFVSVDPSGKILSAISKESYFDYSMVIDIA
jgi:hypothetical protein